MFSFPRGVSSEEWSLTPLRVAWAGRKGKGKSASGNDQSPLSHRSALNALWNAHHRMRPQGSKTTHEDRNSPMAEPCFGSTLAHVLKGFVNRFEHELEKRRDWSIEEKESHNTRATREKNTEQLFANCSCIGSTIYRMLIFTAHQIF